jgi:hypothetical protein
VQVDSSGIAVRPLVGFERASLVVAGPTGLNIGREFGPGEAPNLSFAQIELADGYYNYELRFALPLDVDAQRALTEAEAIGDEVAAGQIEKSVLRLGGRFQVSQGSVVVSNQIESDGPSPRDSVIPDDLIVEGDACIGGNAGCTAGMFFDTNVGNADVIASSFDPQIFWQDLSADADDFAIEVSEGRLGIFNETDNSMIVTLEESAQAASIYVGDGEIGLFTATPQNNIELTVFETSGTIPEIRLANDTQLWDLRSSSDDFQIRDATASTIPFVIEHGATGTTLVVADTGDVGIGNSSPAAKLDVSGGAVISGDISVGSSRSVKHELEAIIPEVTLDGVLALELYRWKYKDDELQATHLGPMAEDFHARFELGRDNEHLSPADSAGLALAAIQGLNERFSRSLGELTDANRRLEADNELLRERLERIERTLEDRW